MRHLKGLTRRLPSQNIQGLTFHFEPRHEDELALLVRQFIIAPEQHATLDVPEPNRGVFLLEWERKTPGRTEIMFRALQNVVPSQLADRELFDFASLKIDDSATPRFVQVMNL